MALLRNFKSCPDYSKRTQQGPVVRHGFVQFVQFACGLMHVSSHSIVRLIMYVFVCFQFVASFHTLGRGLIIPALNHNYLHVAARRLLVDSGLRMAEMVCVEKIHDSTPPPPTITTAGKPSHATSQHTCHGHTAITLDVVDPKQRLLQPMMRSTARPMTRTVFADMAVSCGFRCRRRRGR